MFHITQWDRTQPSLTGMATEWIRFIVHTPLGMVATCGYQPCNIDRSINIVLCLWVWCHVVPRSFARKLYRKLTKKKQEKLRQKQKAKKSAVVRKYKDQDGNARVYLS